ncbi:MAG: hypothetical protein AAF449_14460, partial [Myxococcota bacterium]
GRVGNRFIIDSVPQDLTVSVARNSVINARQPVLFEDMNCMLFEPVLRFDDNLVVNQSPSMSINGNSNGFERTAVLDSAFAAAGCRLSTATLFTNNHFYSFQLSETGTFSFNANAAQNVVGPQDGASFTQEARGLVVGTGIDTDRGADPSLLILIDESQVGPYSTWTGRF